MSQSIIVERAVLLHPGSYLAVSNLAGNDRVAILGYMFFAVGVEYRLNSSSETKFDLIQPNEGVLFVSDGATVPNLLRSFISPIAIFNAALAHDYLYSNYSYDRQIGINRTSFEKNSGVIWNNEMRRHYADEIFNQLLLTNSNIAPMQRVAAVKAVKAFGETAFRSKGSTEWAKQVVNDYVVKLKYSIPRAPASLYQRFKSKL